MLLEIDVPFIQMSSPPGNRVFNTKLMPRYDDLILADSGILC